MALNSIQKLMTVSLDRFFNILTNPGGWDEKKHGKKSSNIRLLSRLTNEIGKLLKHTDNMSDEEKLSMLDKLKQLNEYMIDGICKQMSDPNIAEWDELYGKEKDAISNSCTLSSIALKIDKIEKHIKDLPMIEERASMKRFEKESKMMDKMIKSLEENLGIHNKDSH